MNHTQRIQDLLGGKKLDTPSMNLWKHFPPYDEKPATLVEKTVQFQERFDWDFVKVTFQGLNTIIDFGAEVKWPVHDCDWPDTCSNVGTVAKLGVKCTEDWAKLTVKDVTKGSWGDSLEGAKGVINAFKGKNTPVVVTVFSPLTTGIKLGGDRLFMDMRRDPDVFKKGIEVITETTKNFVKELAKAGADGIFYASQLGTYDKLSRAEYETWGRPYDLAILEETKDMWFNIMHMHGNCPMFDLMEKYPVQAINWHDRLIDKPKMKEARSMTDKLLIGGVDEFSILNHGVTEKEMADHFADAIAAEGTGKLILGPGCCVPLNVSENRLETAKKALASL